MPRSSRSEAAVNRVRHRTRARLGRRRAIRRWASLNARCTWRKASRSYRPDRGGWRERAGEKRAFRSAAVARAVMPSVSQIEIVATVAVAFLVAFVAFVAFVGAAVERPPDRWVGRCNMAAPLGERPTAVDRGARASRPGPSAARSRPASRHARGALPPALLRGCARRRRTRPVCGRARARAARSTTRPTGIAAAAWS